MCSRQALYCLLGFFGIAVGCDSGNVEVSNSQDSSAVDVVAKSIGDGKTHIDSPEIVSAIQNDVKKLAYAPLRGEIDVWLTLTHPALLDLLGGQAKAKKKFPEMTKEIRETDMKISLFEFPTKPDFVEVQSHRFVVVPIRMLGIIEGMKMEILSYYIGQQQDNGTWRYLDGSKLSDLRATLGDQFLLGFPSVYKFPPYEMNFQPMK